MPRVFRYIAPQHAEALVHGGEVLFRSLSYFRDYEDDGLRADEFEGTLVHRPQEGLKVRVERTGQEISVPYRFESTARESEIFVYCLSTTKSEEIARRFGTSTCVEFRDAQEFVSRIRAALHRCLDIGDRDFVHDEVRYYEHHEPPIVDWALPERIALRKPKSYSWQHEYRVAFGVGGAFNVENVRVKLVPIDSCRSGSAAPHQKVVLHLGDLTDLCRIHLIQQR